MLKKIKHVIIIGAVGLSLVACNTNDEAGNSRNGLTNINEQNPPVVTDPSPYQNVTNRHGNQNNFKRNNNDDDNISALTTNVNSKKYPHTKAIIVQKAKYDFVVDGEKDRRKDKKHKHKHRGHVREDRNARNNTERIVRRFAQRGGNQENQQFNASKRRQQERQAQLEQTTNREQQAQQQEPTRQQQQPEQQAQQQEPTRQQQQPEQQAPKQQQTQQQAPTASISNYAQQVITLTNQERQKNGLQPLQGDATLSNVALKKSQDMQQKNYFSHTSPTYGSPFDMMRDFGVTYRSAGENIAQGQRTPEEVVKAWMNSPGHRANILSNKFTHIGVGHESNGNYWTQMFIGK